MRAEEFTLPDINDCLVELCDLVIQGQRMDPNYYGWVAAAVIDPSGNYVQGINVPQQGKRVHAERVAIANYQTQYGKIPKDSIIVTTLSPCNEQHDETADGRWGISCCDLINQVGIRTVYCGYSDPTQTNNHNHYREIITDNKQIQTLCKKFASVFLDIEQLDELSFLGSPCTRDCSGHRAGYNWAKQHINQPANSASQSFNNGVALAQTVK